MTFGDLIGWVLKFFVGEKSGRASQRAEDVAAGQQERVDALETRAKVDDVVRRADDAARRRELRDWTLTIPRPDRKD
jgi:hypothetical protein